MPTSAKKHTTVPPTAFDPAQIPNVDDSPEVQAAITLFRRLEAELKAVVLELSRPDSCYEAPGQAPFAYVVEQDATALLHGAPVASLTVPTRESKRGQLTRQRLALETAVKTARGAIILAQGRAVAAAVEKLTPTAQKIVGRTLDSLEAAFACIKDESDFYAALRAHGIKPESAQAHWTLTRFLGCLLFGGSAEIAGLCEYIRERRQLWKLDGPKNNPTNGRKKAL